MEYCGFIEKKMSSSHRAQANVIMFLIVALLMCSAGCGGGGGGGGVGIGDRGGSGGAPVIALTYPAPDSRISDVAFHAEDTYIQFSYIDVSPMVVGTLRVSLKMDNGAAQDITSYFQSVNASTIKSSNLHEKIATLFNLATNDTTHTIVVTASIQDTAQNTGQSTASFTVYPAGPPVVTP